LGLNSERGTVTAELAIALPAVLVLLTLALQALSLQGVRIGLIAQAAELARSAARGEVVTGAREEGNLVCVTKTKQAIIPISEKQCARRLGL
jgi:hypothetical protein